tara:strand:+ start:4199 stop:4513 length:315 start_codon:yes stop_codon:yes gene_type:complete
LLASLSDALGTHISIYLTIVTGYIIAAYLVGTKLTRLQVAIATGIYLVAYIFEFLILTTIIRTIGKQSSQLLLLDPAVAIGMMAQARALYIGLVILIAGLIAPL